MNCSKCGNPIPEGSAFCLTCGTPAAPAQAPAGYGTYAAPAQAPVGYDAYGNPVQAPAQAPVGYDAYGNPAQAPVPPAPVGYDAYGNPIYAAPAAPKGPGPFANFLPSLKGFFSKNLVEAVANALKSNGLEWIIFGGASILMFAIALIANVGCAIGQIIPGYNMLPAEAKNMVGGMIPYVLIFFLFFLLGAVVYGLLSLGVFLIGGKFCDEKPSFFGALNLVGLAALPVTAVYTLNLIVGLLSVWICAVLSIIAIIVSLLLVYAALAKTASPDKPLFIGYAIVVSAVVVVALVLAWFFVSTIFNNATSSALSGMMGGSNALSAFGDLY